MREEARRRQLRRAPAPPSPSPTAARPQESRRGAVAVSHRSHVAGVARRGRRRRLACAAASPPERRWREPERVLSAVSCVWEGKFRKYVRRASGRAPVALPVRARDRRALQSAPTQQPDAALAAVVGSTMKAAGEASPRGGSRARLDTPSKRGAGVGAARREGRALRLRRAHSGQWQPSPHARLFTARPTGSQVPKSGEHIHTSRVHLSTYLPLEYVSEPRGSRSSRSRRCPARIAPPLLAVDCEHVAVEAVAAEDAFPAGIVAPLVPRLFTGAAGSRSSRSRRCLACVGSLGGGREGL